jgi:hypothetical protein
VRWLRNKKGFYDTPRWKNVKGVENYPQGQFDRVITSFKDCPKKCVMHFVDLPFPKEFTFQYMEVYILCIGCSTEIKITPIYDEMKI